MRDSLPAPDVVDWLLAGDVSIQYQVRRDLLGRDDRQLQARIAGEGWGAQLLACRNADGSWGRGFYQPKWTSSHYTLLDLRTLALPPDNRLARLSVEKVLAEERKADGGIGPGKSIGASDVCVNGMFLNYACYFGAEERALRRVVDFILGQLMGDGGFNCQSNRKGARHSSLHSTLSVLEGFLEYRANGYTYRGDEMEQAATSSRAFILQHRLFRSDRTGEVIQRDFLQFPFPPRWKYNVLRALDYFCAARAPWDPRMAEALEVVLSRRGSDGRWRLNAAHPGLVHFTLERPGQPSRWNTLLALRVLASYGSATDHRGLSA
jgi:hypothetical protein